MKNIIVVLSGLLIGYLEATAEPPTEVADPGSPASARSRTISSSSVSGPQKTKPIYIAYELPHYEILIKDFKKRVAGSKATDTNTLKEELFSILRSACFKDSSFLEKIQNYVKLEKNLSTKNTILEWFNMFKSERAHQLDIYTSVISDLLNGYVRVNVDEAASNATILSFRELLEAAKDNLDLKDIEKIVQNVFFSKKSTEEKIDEKSDTAELDDTDSLKTECGLLFLTCLEPYKFSTPSRSRTSSFF
ncbi:MAG: hypothetical protein WCJ92_01455 [Alphaproteobacteria bacterium]